MHSTTQSARAKNGKYLAHLTVGSRSAMINGVLQHLTSAPFAAQGHVMVPLRLISEAAGATVACVSSPRSVNITHRTVAAAAAAPVVAADPVASAAPVAEEEHRGIPWWIVASQERAHHRHHQQGTQQRSLHHDASLGAFV